MKRFLIVKLSSLGDIIQSFPCISYLKAKFPETQIDWAVETSHQSLLRAHPDINHVIAFDTKSWRKKTSYLGALPEIKTAMKSLRETTYDAIFDLQGNTKSGCVTHFAKGADKVGFSWNTLPEKLNYLATTKRYSIDSRKQITEQYLSLLQSYYQDPQEFTPPQVRLRLTEDEKQFLSPFQNQRNQVMVCPGSNWENKKLSKTTLISFLKHTHEQTGCFFHLIWGSEKECKEIEEVHRALPDISKPLGNLSVPLWQNIMGEMDKVISVDSSALHLAASIGTPTFSIFGPSMPAIYKPKGKEHTAIQGVCPYRITFEKRCPQLRSCKTGACTKNLNITDLQS